tara:strand:+ start:53 stop:277 length:225 start_codon:yes stop_codon:yes gene_type:complete
LVEEETVTGSPAVNDKFLQTVKLIAPFTTGVIKTASFVLENVSSLQLVVLQVVAVLQVATVLQVVALLEQSVAQ